jgi:hypothetical protein
MLPNRQDRIRILWDSFRKILIFSEHPVYRVSAEAIVLIIGEIL